MTGKRNESVEKISQRIGDRDVALATFQQTEDISDEIAEAAIKEWSVTHDGEGKLDWNLAEVKTICLRNKANGIPIQFGQEPNK